MPEPDSHNDLSVEAIERVCLLLNALAPDPDLDPTTSGSVDLLSGGLKFGDEVPGTSDLEPELLLQVVAVLRHLWGFRAMRPGSETYDACRRIWELAKQLSPDWPGFDEERQRFIQSAATQAHIATETARFLTEFEEADRRVRETR